MRGEELAFKGCLENNHHWPPYSVAPVAFPECPATNFQVAERSLVSLASCMTGWGCRGHALCSAGAQVEGQGDLEKGAYPWYTGALRGERPGEPNMSEER